MFNSIYVCRRVEVFVRRCGVKILVSDVSVGIQLALLWAEHQQVQVPARAQAIRDDFRRRLKDRKSVEHTIESEHNIE